MSPLIKLHLGSAGYCALLAGLNWFRSVGYSRQFGVTRETLAPIGLGLLLSALVILYLGVHCVRTALSLLKRGRKVTDGPWIESGSVLVYALPLLWHRTATTSWIEPDGVLAVATGGYGHALSPWVCLFAVLGMLLFQILTRLSDGGARPEQGAPGDMVGHSLSSPG
jgi:hypothetical protein